MKTRKRFYSIRIRLLTAFLLLAVVPLSVAGLYGIYYSIRALVDNTLHNIEYEVSSKAEDIEKFLKKIHNHVLYLSRSPTLLELIETENPVIRKRLENEFLNFSKAYPYYYQIRYINESGMEIIRVDSYGDRTEIIPREKLQNKSDRYYFKDSVKYPEGECYVSPMDYNIEWGKVETPLKSVVRFATPVFDTEYKNRGIIIINLYGSYIIEQMQKINIAKSGITFLVNHKGEYLAHSEYYGYSDKAVSNSTSLANGIRNLNKDYPPEIVSNILSKKNGIEIIEDKIVSYSPILTGDRLSKSFWAFSLVYPRKTIFEPIMRFKMVFLIIGAATILASIIIGIFMARHFTLPLSEFLKDVDSIAEGDFSHRLTINSRDELEQLADRFNLMAEKLEEQRKKVINWNEELKREVEKRTKELKFEKNRLEGILTCAAEGIIVADENNKVVMINPSAEKILGIHRNNIVGKNFLQCHRRPENVEEIINKEKSSNLPISTVSVYNSKILDINVVSVKLDERNHGSMMIFRDITDRHKLEESQKKLEKQMFQAEKLSSLAVLSAGLSHEIGNPLAAIKVVVQAMESELNLSGNQKRFSERIITEVNRLNSFLRTFSDFARPTEKHVTTIDPVKILKEVLFWINKKASNQGISIDYRDNGAIPMIKADPQQIHQVLINLILNAMDATPNGGKINILTESDGADIKIKVADTGKGIPAEIIERMFDPFFTTKPTGTGLGLSIAHKIVHDHGGEINVLSEEGKGTTFEVILPV
ncbi:MAG: PAS domain S-box protein [Nitrospinae bacterium]|nr:PAS domain S-box protein [Nitrospinota bacterium]